MLNLAKTKQLLKSGFFIAILILSSFIFSQLIENPQTKVLVEQIQHYYWFYFLILSLMKCLSVIYPPLPGTILTMASIPVLGWPMAFLADTLGGIAGVAISYALSKKYGAQLLNLILGSRLTTKIMAIKLKDKNQIESAVVLRIASGGLFSDGLAWGANIIGFKLTPFLIGYVISHCITTLPIFYFLGISLEIDSWIIVGTLVMIAWLAIYKLKGRYFE